MARRKNVEYMAAEEFNAFGIATDPAMAAKQIADGTLKTTEDVENAEGTVIETFSITVRGKVADAEGVETEKTFYECAAQPFGWTKVVGFSGIFANEGAELADDKIAFIGQVFEGEKQGEVIAKLIELYNSVNRERAKANEYSRVTGIYKPVSEEDKAKAKDQFVKNYAKAFGVSLEQARTDLKAKGVI